MRSKRPSHKPCRDREGHPSGAEQLAEKVGFGQKKVPQGLKPNVFADTYGTDKSVPFQSNAFFRKL
jgi:hypothetical protein